MCGIIGFNWTDKKKIRSLAELMNHRGPDQQDYFVDKSVSLGHKRLSIIDLSNNGKQPMSDSKDEIFIVFNGEIFNFKTIKEDLILKGCKFKSNTDTEVIIYAYKEYGYKCLEKFEGQFAFCLYDKNKQEFFLARDRFGIIPLYYFCDNKKFMFSSELKALIKSGDIPKEINKEAMNHFLFMGYPHLTQSMIHSVKKLRPGHYIIYDLKKSTVKSYKRYWENSFKWKKHSSQKDIERKIVELFDDSIKKRLFSDRPVGVFLSGGIDSSLIVAFASKYMKKVDTFSVYFDHQKFDESKYAKIISRKFSTKHHEIRFTADDVKKYLQTIQESFDEPLSDCSVIPNYILTMEAKKYVTVGISGTGGDELFAGYKRYQHYVFIKTIAHMPHLFKKILKFLCYILGNFSEKFKKFGFLLEKNEKEFNLYPRLFSYFSNKYLNIDTSFTEGFKQYFKNNSIIDAFRFDQSEYLTSNTLFKEDTVGMANSLEGRFPFLDHFLVEFANSIPVKYKIKGSQGKYILRKVASHYLPKEVIKRKKQSFLVPLNSYFRNELKDYTYDIIFNFNDYNYYNKDIILKCWKDHQSGKADYSQLFLTIMTFNLWYKKWIK